MAKSRRTPGNNNKIMRHPVMGTGDFIAVGQRRLHLERLNDARTEDYNTFDIPLNQDNGEETLIQQEIAEEHKRGNSLESSSLKSSSLKSSFLESSSLKSTS